MVAIGGRGAQFCRGRDGKGESRAGMTPYDVRVKMMGAVLDSYQAIWDVPVPVVALVHGDALGFGAALAVGCDITLAASNARFAFPGNRARHSADHGDVRRAGQKSRRRRSLT